MGWEIHITRAKDWADSDTQPITEEEWLTLVHSDAELVIDSRGNGRFFALWLAHSRDNDHPWFDWSYGQIHTTHPDQQTLTKALQIAAQLKAHVQGDECEEYRTPEDWKRAYSPAPTKHWWQFWKT